MFEPDDNFIRPDLRFWYVATPYRSYMGGANTSFSAEMIYELAFEAAARFAARLIDFGVEVYSPIAHSHPISQYVKIADPSSDFWLQRQIPFLRASRGLIIAMMPGWACSSGIRREREFISRERPIKPIFLLQENFKDLPGVLRST